MKKKDINVLMLIFLKTSRRVSALTTQPRPILCLIFSRIISMHPGLNGGVKNDCRWICFVCETMARGCGGGLHAPFNCITRPTFKRIMQNSRGAIFQHEPANAQQEPPNPGRFQQIRHNALSARCRVTWFRVALWDLCGFNKSLNR